MKTLGLIGGMSWESSAMYYQHLNRLVAERLGGLHSAKVVLYSVDFAGIAERQHQGDWQGAGELLADAARKLSAAGAQALLICTNTMHKVADAVEAAVDVPLIHIADVAAREAQRAGVKTVALLGTAFTMEQPFYRERLEQRFGLRVLTPDADERADIHRIIYDELCLGQRLPASRERLRAIIERLATGGAQGVILGCTELPLLIEQDDVSITVLDSTTLHARAAIDFALGTA
ncbi:aspartate/glutamate racemase family protein [Crenobacter cavernae]|uniref:Aspartate/glutamate racemase family protein n=1 Tax=Crenobacter cavernae TaxID=2290923 RepID=A0A345Y276_9NEIS|nr:aspartate/glutamate racemase family protein [Crenobacter cavernae]AXK38028.1 aspartate/glutamate racemase family protein [Crenobacter cavernae]